MGDDASSNTCKFNLDELKRRLLDRGLSEILVDLVLEGYPKEWSCNRKVYKNGYCVFHSVDKPDNFEELFWNEFLRAEREDESIDFSGAIFTQAVFSSLEKRLKASKFVNFLGAEFRGGADFGDSEFEGNVSFRYSRFYRKAYFVDVKFQEQVDFRGAEFRGGADFGDSEFEGNVSFRGAEFHQRADFKYSKFRGEANFGGARFHKRVNFRDSKFYGNVSFEGAEFQGRADFSLSVDGLVDFSYSTFNSLLDLRISPIVPDGGFTLLFHAIDLREPRRVTLTGFPLSSASFLKTDLTDVTLVPFRVYPRESYRILDDRLLHYGNRRAKNKERENNHSGIGKEAYLKEEKSAHGSLSKKNIPSLNEHEKEAYKRLRNSLTMGLVLAEYKSIRKCLEGNKMFTEAAELFINEMKLARKRLSWRNLGDISEKIFHYLYDAIARYGESIGRPLGLYVLVILVASIAMTWVLSSKSDLLSSLFWVFSNPGTAFGLLGRYAWKTVAVSLQIRSFKDFPDMKTVPSTDLLMIEIPLRVLSLVLLGSFFVALKRRLERK